MVLAGLEACVDIIVQQLPIVIIKAWLMEQQMVPVLLEVCVDAI